MGQYDNYDFSFLPDQTPKGEVKQGSTDFSFLPDQPGGVTLEEEEPTSFQGFLKKTLEEIDRLSAPAEEKFEEAIYSRFAGIPPEQVKAIQDRPRGAGETTAQLALGPYAGLIPGRLGQAARDDLIMGLAPIAEVFTRFIERPIASQLQPIAELIYEGKPLPTAEPPEIIKKYMPQISPQNWAALRNLMNAYFTLKPEEIEEVEGYQMRTERPDFGNIFRIRNRAMGIPAEIGEPLAAVGGLALRMMSPEVVGGVKRAVGKGTRVIKKGAKAVGREAKEFTEDVMVGLRERAIEVAQIAKDKQEFFKWARRPKAEKGLGLSSKGAKDAYNYIRKLTREMQPGTSLATQYGTETAFPGVKRPGIMVRAEQKTPINLQAEVQAARSNLADLMEQTKYYTKTGEKVPTDLLERISDLKALIPQIGIKPADVQKPGVSPEVATIYEQGGTNVKIQKDAEGQPALINFDIVVDDPKVPATLSMKPADVTPEKVQAKIEQKRHAFQEAEKPTKPFTEEAKKYKTAEEFVASKPTFYHGTGAEFEEFDTSSTKQFGAHFTPNKEMAKEFTGSEGGRVVEVYLDIKNPYDLVSDLGDWTDIEMWKELLGPANYELFSEKEMRGWKTAEDVKKSFIKKGYDGIKYQNSFEGQTQTDMGSEKQDVYIAFHSEQIKTKSQLTDIWKQAQPTVKKVRTPRAVPQKLLDKADEQGDLRMLIRSFGRFKYPKYLEGEIGKGEQRKLNMRKLHGVMAPKAQSLDSLLKELKAAYPHHFNQFETDADLLRYLLAGAKKAPIKEPDYDAEYAKREAKLVAPKEIKKADREFVQTKGKDVSFEEFRDNIQPLSDTLSEIEYSKRLLEMQGTKAWGAIRQVPGMDKSGKWWIAEVNLFTKFKFGGMSLTGGFKRTPEEARSELRDMILRLGLDLKYEKNAYVTSLGEQKIATEKVMKDLGPALEEVGKKLKEGVKKGDYGTLGEKGIPRQGMWITDEDMTANVPGQPSAVETAIAEFGDFDVVLKWAMRTRERIPASELVRRHKTGTLKPKKEGEYLREIFIVEGKIKKQPPAKIEPTEGPAVNPESGMMLVNPDPERIKEIEYAVTKLFDIEKPFKTLGAPKTGLAVKVYPSRIEAGQEKATKLIENLMKKYPELKDKDYQVLALLVEKPSRLDKIGTPALKKNSRIIYDIEQIHEQYFTTLKNRAPGKFKYPWPQSLIYRLKNLKKRKVESLRVNTEKLETNPRSIDAGLVRYRIGELKKDITEITNEITFLEVNEPKFVHIPIKLWFQDKLQKNPHYLKTMITPTFKGIIGRGASTIQAMVESGMMKAEDVDIRDILGTYVQYVESQLAQLDIMYAALDEGMMAPLEDVPNDWVSVPSTILPAMKGVAAHPVMYELLESYFSALHGGAIVGGRILGTIKMMQFYNPFFLPMYDLYQSAMAGAFNPKMGKSIGRAWKAWTEKNDDYWDAFHHGLFSTPYISPFENFKAHLDWAKRSNDPLVLKLAKYAGDRMADKDFLGLIYGLSWNAAWRMDKLIRLMTYFHLIDKEGLPSEEAAQVGATFHADYAMLPPNTRKWLNKIWFTPSFKFAMAKLYYRIAKNAVKMFANPKKYFDIGGKTGKGPRANFKLTYREQAQRKTEAIYGTAAAIMLGIWFGRDLLMTKKYGFKREEFTRKYSKEVEIDGEMKELVITFSSPDNMIQRYWYKTFKPRPGSKFLDRLTYTLKSELHPVYQIPIELKKNEGPDFMKIYDTSQPLPVQLGQSMKYVASRIFRIGEEFLRDEMRQDEREDVREALKESTGYLDAQLFRIFSFQYLRNTKDRRAQGMMYRQMKEFKDMLKAFPPKSKSEWTARIDRFYKRMEETEKYYKK